MFVRALERSSLWSIRFAQLEDMLRGRQVYSAAATEQCSDTSHTDIYILSYASFAQLPRMEDDSGITVRFASLYLPGRTFSRTRPKSLVWRTAEVDQRLYMTSAFKTHFESTRYCMGTSSIRNARPVFGHPVAGELRLEPLKYRIVPGIGGEIETCMPFSIDWPAVGVDVVLVIVRRYEHLILGFTIFLRPDRVAFDMHFDPATEYTGLESGLY